MPPREIPFPFTGRLIKGDHNKALVTNAIDGLAKSAYPRQIYIEIEVGLVTDPRLAGWEGELVTCKPNKDETDWIVSRV